MAWEIAGSWKWASATAMKTMRAMRAMRTTKG